MKLGTIQKLDSLKAAGYDNALVNKMLEQGQAAEELFLKCDIHPGLHAFSMLYDIKRQLGKEFPGCTIYAGEGTGDYLVDSVFDEIIDDIVDALETNCFGKSPNLD